MMYNVLITAALCCRFQKEEDSLTISNVNEGDEGTYTCIAKSEIDLDAASGRLTVLGTHSEQQMRGTTVNIQYIQSFFFFYTFYTLLKFGFLPLFS